MNIEKLENNEMNDLVREHYEGQSLDQDQLNNLKQMIESPATEETQNIDQPVRKFPMFSLISSIAACLILTFSLSFWIYTQTDHRSQRTDHVLTQIAMYHHKGLAPDYSNEDFQKLCDNMDKLDFQMIDSEHLKERGLKIVGARYCSVGPLMAAQIKLVDDQNRRYTLYQSRDDKYLKGVKNHTQVRDGVTMEVWRESGVWMALAGPTGS